MNGRLHDVNNKEISSQKCQMSDIEEDLLALAGADGEEEDEDEVLTTSSKRTKKTDNSGSKRRRIEVEGDEEDDEEEDEEDDYNPAAIGTMTSAGPEEEEEEEEEENPFPLGGKYKDEDDRNYLESLPEMERETLLFERSQILQKYKDRQLFRQRGRNLKEQQRNRQAQEETKTRTSTRASHVTGHSDLKASKLSQLRRQREKKSKDRRYSSGEEDEDDEEENEYNKSEGSEYEEEEDYNPYERKGRVEKEEQEEVEWAEDDLEREVAVSDFNNVKIGRSFVAKFCFYPGFNDAVKGHYGRVNVGVDKRSGETLYRMVKIEKVFLQKPYNMGKFFTNQYFGVTQGKDRKVFQMNYFSDGPLSQQEYERYMVALDGAHITKPSVYSLINKAKEMNAFVSQPLTDKLTDTIVRNRMLFNKKLSGSNAVLEKTVLKEKLQYAVESNNEKDVAKYSAQLRNFEKRMTTYEKHHENDQSGIKKLGALTSKNRKLNMDRIRSAESNKKEDVQIDSKSDPFSRLKTRTKVYYQEIQDEENERAKNIAEQNQLNQNQEAANKKEKEILSAQFRRLGGLEKMIGSIDFQFTFDV